MSGIKPPFLDRQIELARLRRLLQAKKSLLLYGAAGIGKSSLLAELGRGRGGEERILLFSPGNVDPARWLRQVLLTLVCDHSPAGLCQRLGLPRRPTTTEARAAVSRKSAGALRALVFEVFSGEPATLALDPVESLSGAFFELLRDLERATHTPLLLAARSPHMEDIGQATRFHWPREQRVALGSLPEAEAGRIFDFALAEWRRRPANLEDFRTHVLDYAGGNPGVLLGLLELAREHTYWAGDSLKIHLLTVDFNLRNSSAAAANRPL